MENINIVQVLVKHYWLNMAHARTFYPLGDDLCRAYNFKAAAINDVLMELAGYNENIVNEWLIMYDDNGDYDG